MAGIVHLIRYITAPQGKNHRVGEVFDAIGKACVEIEQKLGIGRDGLQE